MPSSLEPEARPTVSLVLRALVDGGLVSEAEHHPYGPHYGAVYYEADPEAAVVLGIDFGDPAVRTALCDLGSDVRAREEIRSRGSVEERIGVLAGSVRSLLRRAEVPGDLLENAVGSLPAVVSPTNGRVSASDLPGWEVSDLREQLEHALGVSVTLENDVNLAAVAEQRRAGRDGLRVPVGRVRPWRRGDARRGRSTAATTGTPANWLAATLDLPLGGSVGAKPALLDPVRGHLEHWLPFPAPRVEVSAPAPTRNRARPSAARREHAS